VEAQQKQILLVVRRLADEGQIMLGAKGEDSYVWCLTKRRRFGLPTMGNGIIW
jgi:hypothetical protein